MRELTRLYPLPKVPEGWTCRVVDVTKSGAAVAVIDAVKGAVSRA